MSFKYLNLPEIPEHLILKSVEDFAGLENIFSIKGYEFYKQYNIPNKELTEYIEDIFKCTLFCSYQVIKQGITIHKDRNRTECINYLIATGGESAALNIHDDNKKIVLRELIPTKKWHWIDVSQYHSVTGLQTTRISLSVSNLGRSIHDFT